MVFLGISRALVRKAGSVALAGLLWHVLGGVSQEADALAQMTNSQVLPGLPARGQTLAENPTPASIGDFATDPDPVESEDSSGGPAAIGQPAPQVIAAAPVTNAINSLRAWQGQKVEAIEFRGVEAGKLQSLPSTLAQHVGSPLDPELVRQSLRRLFSTGLYEGIEVLGIRSPQGVVLIFEGKPRFFFGDVDVEGVKSDRLTTQLESASKLTPGAPFSEDKLSQADKLLQQALADNGYYEAKVSRTQQAEPADQQMNVVYTIVLGKRARVGEVKVQGDSGMPENTFRKRARLKKGSKVDHDTVSRALADLRKHYQKKDRLEADVTLASKEYKAPRAAIDYGFNANQGPIVKVEVKGVRLGAGKVRKLIPIYEEGAVDDDLLNEGDRSLRDYYQRQGYFDSKVTHAITNLDLGHSQVSFQVVLGMIHRVDAVEITGDKYFNSDTLQEHLAVRKADVFARHGLFSQSLVNADIGSISALYQMNGFSKVKVSPEIDDSDDHETNPKAVAHLRVKYKIEEGTQQKVGRFDIEGTRLVLLEQLRPLLNTQPGQPYSPQNVEGDRDAVRTYYLSHGFDRMELQLIQNADPADASLVNVTMKVTEGDQIFVNKVLISGLRYTRPEVVDRKIQIHAGDALNESALLETQRSLYDLALFNEVNTAVQNPTGEELRKNVLLQLTEARRWDINYGFGFEAQTGTPSRSCPTSGCQPDGKASVSPKILFDLTRINIRGRDQSVSIRTSYGTLEKRATLIWETPHLFNHPNFDVSVSGGYTNSQDITTYAASWLEASLRVTERFLGEKSKLSRANTLIYSLTYRRVKVDPNSIQVAPETIPLFSQPVRVGGPGLTWIRDTRDQPLDAHRGTYNSMQEFSAGSVFGSQADFNRVDLTNSSYYQLGKRHWVLARSTRYGFENPYGGPKYNAIPLPERLYAGGASSHRGFTINAAGPRDPQTGFPIGGEGAFVNTTELRLPNPTLPFVGTNLGFVLFHDMGNVFKTPSEIWSSSIRFHQPHQAACKVLTATPPAGDACSFAYFSHALGLGLRYRTPIGPVRVDFTYNLNPPTYPVTFNSAVRNFQPHVGQASHFNFFFSMGQSF